MNLSPFFPAFLLGAALALVSPAAAQTAAPVSLRFDHAPLDNVARILSARFATPVTIAGNTRAPITGDFSRLDMRQALAEAARQAGLVLLPAQPGASPGFRLGSGTGFQPVNSDHGLEARATSNLAPSRTQAERRAVLLKKRKDLLDQASLLEQ